MIKCEKCPGRWRLLSLAVGLSMAAATARAGSISGLGDGTGFQVNTNGVSTPTISGGVATMTQSVPNAPTNDIGEITSVFYSTPQNISQFTVTFTYSATKPGVNGFADGLTFTIQNDTNGASALGTGGAGLGFGGITHSVAVELNIWPYVNGGVGTAIGTNGTTGDGGGLSYTNTLPVDLIAAPVLVNISYDGSTLTETLTQEGISTPFTLSASLDIASILGSSTGYVGFTAADGLGRSTQTVSDFRFISPVPLPASAWTGLSLMAGLVVFTRLRKRWHPSPA